MVFGFYVGGASEFGKCAAKKTQRFIVKPKKVKQASEQIYLVISRLAETQHILMFEYCWHSHRPKHILIDV